MTPFCSVIIPTIGRPTLERAVQSVLSQQAVEPSLEVVVVNDSAGPLPRASWQESGCVRVIGTNRRERSVARNTGAAIGRGHYLWFLDDDDWLLPGALAEMNRLALDSPDAGWLHGGVRVVDGNGRVIGEENSGLTGRCLAQVVGGAWAPIQASMIGADLFFQIGGFDPSICGTEDLDLCRRAAVHGAFANSPAVVACLFRGPTWRTSTDYGRATRDTQRSRDAVLDEPGAFGHLVRSARESSDPAYWFGRLLRVYASAAHMNLRQRQVSRAASRAVLGATGVAVAGSRVFSRRFWKAFRAHHVPGTMYFIEQAEQLPRTPPHTPA